MNSFAVFHPPGSRCTEFTNRVDSLISAYPTELKVASVVLAVMGIVAVSIPLIAPIWSVTILASWKITGVTLTVGYLYLYCLIPQRRQAIVQRERDVISAAVQGHLDVPRDLLAEGAIISQEDRRWAVRSAAVQGHLDVLRELLAGGATISQEDRGWAVRSVADEGHLDVLRELLAGGAIISQEHRGWAVRLAADKGHLDVLRELLSGGATISQEDRGWAVRLVADEGHLDVLRELLPEGAIISQYYRETAVESAASSGHLAILQLLLQGHPLTQTERERLVLNVASRGHRDVLEYLLQQGPIGESVRDSARTQAGRNEQAVRESRAAIVDLLEMAHVVQDVGGVASGAYEEGTLYTTFEEVKADPTRFLELMSGSFPLRVVLTNNPQAFDLGGVTKQLITTLMEALVDKDIIQRNDKLLPTATSETAPSMHHMGQFFSALFTRNRNRTDKFVTGPLFNPVFFDLVNITLQEGSFEDRLKQIAQKICETDSALELAKQALIDPDSHLQDYRDIMDDNKADPQEMFIGYLRAAAAFGAGLSEEFRAQLQQADVRAFITKMQGELITIDKLLRVCHVMGDEPGFIEKAEWVKQKLGSADRNWLKQFVFAITGNHVLPARFEIRLGWRPGGAFEIHTCFNSLDLPNIPMTKELFLEALDAVVRGNSYNIA